MKKIAIAAALAVVAFAALPVAGSVTPASAQGIDVRVGGHDRDDLRFRDRDDYRFREHRRGVVVGLGERSRCRTIITKIHRGGREITKRERICRGD